MKMTLIAGLAALIATSACGDTVIGPPGGPEPASLRPAPTVLPAEGAYPSPDVHYSLEGGLVQLCAAWAGSHGPAGTTYRFEFFVVEGEGETFSYLGQRTTPWNRAEGCLELPVLAEFEDGAVGLPPGTHTIWVLATSTRGGGPRAEVRVSEYGKMSIVIGDVEVDDPVYTLSVAPESAEILVGQTQAFTATLYRDGSVSDEVLLVVWSVNDETIVEIDAEGVATGLAEGTVVVQVALADDPSVLATAVLDVQPQPVVYTISVSPLEATIQVGETQQFTATVYADDVEVTEDVPEVVWSSKNVAVATVDGSGKATGGAEGNTEILASLVDDGEVTATAIITIAPLPEPIASTFDVDNEGWSIIGDPNSRLLYLATGGNPGGHLRLQEAAQGAADFFVAPVAFLGDRSGFREGSIAWDIRISHTSAVQTYDVVLAGGGLTLYNLAPGPLTTNTWVRRSVTLADGMGWRVGTPTGDLATPAQLAQVLADVTALRIRGDYRSGQELVDLDNVILAPRTLP